MHSHQRTNPSPCAAMLARLGEAGVGFTAAGFGRLSMAAAHRQFHEFNNGGDNKERHE